MYCRPLAVCLPHQCGLAYAPYCIWTRRLDYAYVSGQGDNNLRKLAIHREKTLDLVIRPTRMSENRCLYKRQSVFDSRRRNLWTFILHCRKGSVVQKRSKKKIKKQQHPHMNQNRQPTYDRLLVRLERSFWDEYILTFNATKMIWYDTTFSRNTLVAGLYFNLLFCGTKQNLIETVFNRYKIQPPVTRLPSSYTFVGRTVRNQWKPAGSLKYSPNNHRRKMTENGFTFHLGTPFLRSVNRPTVNKHRPIVRWYFAPQRPSTESIWRI